MVPDAQYQQQQANGMQIQQGFGMQMPDPNMQPNQGNPMMFPQQQNMMMMDPNNQQMQQQMLQLQMQNQMLQNQLVLQNQGNAVAGLGIGGLGGGGGNGNGDAHMYTTLFKQRGVFIGETISKLASNMIENCGFSVTGVKLRFNANFMFESITNIINNKVVAKLHQANPSVEEDTIKNSKIVKCATILMEALQKRLTCLLIFLFILSIVSYIIIDVKDKEMDPYWYENESDVDWINRIGLIQTMINVAALILVFIGKIRFTNFLLSVIGYVTILNVFLTYGQFIIGIMMSAGSSHYGESNFFMVNMMSMMFLQICYIIVPIQIFGINNIFKRIFVIVGEDPVSTLK